MFIFKSEVLKVLKLKFKKIGNCFLDVDFKIWFCVYKVFENFERWVKGYILKFIDYDKVLCLNDRY